MTQNEIYLRRSSKVIVKRELHELPAAMLAAALKNIATLGFTCSPSLIAVLRTLSEVSFMRWYKPFIHHLRRQAGAHVKYKPVYPNFPRQVMEADEALLYLDALLQYRTLELPPYGKAKRAPLKENVSLKVIELGDEEDFCQLMKQLMVANASLSEQDRKDLAWVIEHEDNVEKLLPGAFPYKEQLAFVTAALLQHQKAGVERLQPFFQTATDVLRLAACRSGGDISLAESTPFRKFSRPERRLLLGLLEGCPSRIEDMLRHRDRWVRLGEILHPAEYKKRFPLAHEAFDTIRNDRPYATFNRQLEQALSSWDTDQAVELLLQRPGEFARRLDHLLRLEDEEGEWIVSFFASVADRVSTPVLLQVMAHFKHRHGAGDGGTRVFFPKGVVAKAFTMTDQRLPVAPGACEAVVQVCEQTLQERFAKLPSLGKVYIGEAMNNFIVPFSQRSASKSLRTLVRGSKLSMPDGDTIRFFLWWKEGKVNGVSTGRVDIDLSAVLYDENWNYMEHISYTNLRSDHYRAAHSGDIVSAPNGACEFIDLDIPSAVSYGGRYVAAALYSFTSQPYCNLPECFAGWMMREYPDSGEIFEPAAVVDRIDLASNSQIAIPVILDLAERTIIWCDLALKRYPNFYNNVEANKNGMAAMGKAMMAIYKPTLHDLFRLHALSRGQLVERMEDADTIFDIAHGITPFDIETIMASFLAC